jgi:hypothetical protein
MNSIRVGRFLPLCASLSSAWLLHLANARGGVVYSNSFNDTVGTIYPEWSSSAITYSNSISPPGSGALPGPTAIRNINSPNGAQRFIGLFGGPPIGTARDPGWNHTRVEQTIALSLTHLPPHTALRVTFDLYTIRSWDGNSPAYGRDRFILRVAGGPILLETTFSNNPKTIAEGSYQDFPVVNSAPWSGALSVGTLGYDGFFRDGIYRLKYSFAGTNANVRIDFTSSLFEGKGTNDETWGLDNVIVQTVP